MCIRDRRRGDGVPEEFDVAQLGEVTEEEWRTHWPTAQSAESVDDAVSFDAAAAGLDSPGALDGGSRDGAGDPFM